VQDRQPASTRSRRDLSRQPITAAGRAFRAGNRVGPAGLRRRGPRVDHQSDDIRFFSLAVCGAVLAAEQRKPTTSSAGWLHAYRAFNADESISSSGLGLTAGRDSTCPDGRYQLTPFALPTPPHSWRTEHDRTDITNAQLSCCNRLGSRGDSHAHSFPPHACLGWWSDLSSASPACRDIGQNLSDAASDPPSLSASGRRAPRQLHPGDPRPLRGRRPGPQALILRGTRGGPRDRLQLRPRARRTRRAPSCTVSSGRFPSATPTSSWISGIRAVAPRRPCGAQGRVAERYRGAFRWSVARRCSSCRLRRAHQDAPGNAIEGRGSPTISMSCPITSAAAMGRGWT